MKKLKEQRDNLIKEVKTIKRLKFDEFLQTVDNNLVIKVNQIKALTKRIEFIENSQFIQDAINNQ